MLPGAREAPPGSGDRLGAGRLPLVAADAVGHHRAVTARTELSSLASTLDELNRRITALADRAQGERDDELATALFGVERSLQGALRRLRRLEPGGRT